MTEKEMKAWIDRASYKQLLDKNRYAPVGDPFFIGEIGEYFGQVMAKKKALLDHSMQVRISIQIDRERGR